MHFVEISYKDSHRKAVLIEGCVCVAGGEWETFLVIPLLLFSKNQQQSNGI